MKNKEKFAKEIIEATVRGEHISVDKQSGKISPCFDADCEKCLFFRADPATLSCRGMFSIWANGEYKEPKIFTDREKAFVKFFPLIKYIARNMNGDLYIFASKPEKGNSSWKSVDGYAWWIQDFMCLNFNSITWEDKEPTSREEILGE